MTDFSVFKKRNLERNVIVKMNGLHNLFPCPLSSFLQKILREILYLNEKINFFLFKKLTIPQIEFILTTHCNLKCRQCAAYIPSIENINRINLSFEEFKIQFDNLINSVDKIQNFILTGGEPLLCKDFVKICAYAAENKKIKNLWIFTNATIEISDELFCLLKKYRNKIIMKPADYSGNSELKDSLKLVQILERIKKSGCRYIYIKDNKWIPVLDIKQYSRTKEENRRYFRCCLHPCLAVFEGYFYVCPRGAVLTQKKDLKSDLSFIVNLNRKTVKKDIIDFYNGDYFPYCDFCDFIQERGLPLIEPAEQIKS